MFPRKMAILACIASRVGRMRLPEGLPESRDREAFGAHLLVELLHSDVIGTFRLAITESG